MYSGDGVRACPRGGQPNKNPIISPRLLGPQVARIAGEKTRRVGLRYGYVYWSMTLARNGSCLFPSHIAGCLEARRYVFTSLSKSSSFDISISTALERFPTPAASSVALCATTSKTVLRYSAHITSANITLCYCIYIGGVDWPIVCFKSSQLRWEHRTWQTVPRLCPLAVVKGGGLRDCLDPSTPHRPVKV